MPAYSTEKTNARLDGLQIRQLKTRKDFEELRMLACVPKTNR